LRSYQSRLEQSQKSVLITNIGYIGGAHRDQKTISISYVFIIIIITLIIAHVAFLQRVVCRESFYSNSYNSLSRLVHSVGLSSRNYRHNGGVSPLITTPFSQQLNHYRAVWQTQSWLPFCRTCTSIYYIRLTAFAQHEQLSTPIDCSGIGRVFFRPGCK
jgi:hypothetical protein